MAVEPGAGGRVFVADVRRARVQVFTKAGQFVRTIGEGSNSELNFNYPNCVCVEPDADRLYVADFFNHRVQVLTKDGQHVHTLGVTGQAGTGDHQLDSPCGMYTDQDRVYVADRDNHRVQVLEKDGTFVRTIGVTGEKGSGNHQFNLPHGVRADPGPNGRYVYVADSDNHRVQVFTKDGQFVRTLLGVTGQRGSGNHQLNSPYDVYVEPGPLGRLYVADSGNHRIEVFLK